MKLQDIFDSVAREVAGLRAGPPRARSRQFIGSPSELIGGSESAFGNSFQFGDDDALVEMKHNKGWVYTAITRIGEAGSSQPIHVARRTSAKLTADARMRRKVMLRGGDVPMWSKRLGGDLEILPEHGMLDAIDDPNEIMVRAVLLRVTFYSFLLTGKAFWWTFERDGRRQIWPVPPHWVTPDHDTNKLFARWKVRPTGSAQEVPVDGAEMGYFFNPDPRSPIDAISPLRTIGQAVLVDEAILEGQHRAMKNGIFPGTLITVGRLPGSDPNEPRAMLTRDQRETLIRSIQRVYRGVVNADEPLIQDALIESVQPFTRMPREMDWMNSGEATKARITQAYGVNPLIYGQVEGANRAQALVARQLFAERVVNPILELFSQVMTAWIAPLFAQDGERLVAWIEPSVADDDDVRLRDLTLLDKAKAIGRKELRVLLGSRYGLSPEPEEEDTILISNTQKVQEFNLDPPEELEEPPVPPPGGERPIDGDEGEEGDGGDGRPPNDGPGEDEIDELSFDPGHFSKPYYKNAAMRFLKQRQRGFELLRSEAQAFFARQREDVVARLGDLDFPTADLVFNPVEWGEKLRDAMQRPLARIMVESAIGELASVRSTVLRQAEIDDILIDLPPRVRDAVDGFLDSVMSQGYWDEINQTTRAQIDDAIREGMREHLTPREIAVQIVDAFDPSATLGRAMRIARTEMGGAQNAGHFAVISELSASGDVIGKTWLTIPDDRRRDSHAQLHEVTVAPDADFVVGGFPAPYPGHESLPGRERINCRCVIVGEIPQLAARNGRKRIHVDGAA